MVEWLHGYSADKKQQIKNKSLLKKYFTFCIDTKVDFFPLTFVQMCRYVIWLPQNNVGPWESVTKYTNAIWQLNLRTKQPDPITGSDSWDLLRKRFKEEIEVVPLRAEKLALQLAHYEALAMDTLEDPTPRRVEEHAQDSTMFFTGLRVGHIAPAATTRPDHVLRWEHIKFIPDVDNCTQVFLFVRTTKTRSGHVFKPWWTAFGRILDPEKLHLCPVKWLVLHYRLNLQNNPAAAASDPVFKTKAGAMLNRTAYTKELKVRLTRSVKNFLNQPHFNCDNYSGISWRKATLSQLVGKIPDSRAANFADHADIETTRKHYATDSIADHAALSNIIGGFCDTNQ